MNGNIEWVFDLSSTRDVIFLILIAVLLACWSAKVILHLKLLRKEYSAESNFDLFYFLNKRKNFAQVLMVYFPVPVLGKTGRLQKIIKVLVISIFLNLVILVLYYPILN